MRNLSVASSLLAGVVLIGCVLPPQPGARRDPVASPPSTAQALADDPEMATLLSLIAALAREHRESAVVLPEGEVLLSRADSASTPAALDAFVATDLRMAPATANSAHSTLAELLARHGLSTAPTDEVTTTLHDAVDLFFASASLEGWVEYELRSLEEPIPEVSDECLVDCKRRFAVAMYGAIQAWIGTMAGCVLLPPPANLFCVAGAMAVYAYACSAANAANNRCVAECEGIPPDEYCNDDSMCAPDEFCDRGLVLGVGLNECRPRRADGRTCTRSGNCLSNCCRYRPTSNPIAPICRPASRCAP